DRRYPRRRPAAAERPETRRRNRPCLAGRYRRAVRLISAAVGRAGEARRPDRSGAGRAAHIDHIAVTGCRIGVDEARDQHTPVERNDLAVLLAAGRTGRTDVVLAARAALQSQFLR